MHWCIFIPTHISSHLAQILMPEAREHPLQWAGSRRWHFGSCWHYAETERAWQGPVSTNYISRPAECKTAHPHSQSNPAQGLPVPLYGDLERCTNASLMAQTWSRESREYNGRFSALNAGSDENQGFMTSWMRYSEYCGKSHQGWLNKHKRRIPKIVSRT